MSKPDREDKYSYKIFGLLNEYNKHPDMHIQKEVNKVINEVRLDAIKGFKRDSMPYRLGVRDERKRIIDIIRDIIVYKTNLQWVDVEKELLSSKTKEVKKK